MPVETLPRPSKTKYRWEIDMDAIRVIGKGGLDYTARGVFPEVRERYPKGYKGSVDSTAAVAAGFSRPVEIRSTTAAGNAFNFAIGSAEQSMLLPRVRVELEAQVGTDPGAEMFRKAVAETAVAPKYDVYDGETPHSLIVPTEDDRAIFSQNPSSQELPLFKEPKTPPGFIYLTSLAGSNWHVNYERIGDYAAANDVFLAVSAGSPQIKSLEDTSELGLEQQAKLYKTISQASMLFANKDEVTKLVNGKGAEAKKDPLQLILQAKDILGCESISMTNGGEDSLFIDYDTTVFKMPVYKSDNPQETSELDYTGAGDTYAANFMRAFMAGQSIPDCMRRGATAAYAVIHETGVPPGYVQKHKVEKVLLDTAKEDAFQAKVVFLDERRKKEALEELAEAS